MELAPDGLPVELRPGTVLTNVYSGGRFWVLLPQGAWRYRNRDLGRRTPGYDRAWQANSFQESFTGPEGPWTPNQGAFGFDFTYQIVELGDPWGEHE